MIQITDPRYFVDLSKMFEHQLREETKRRVWLDSGYYEGFRRWLKETYNIDNQGNTVLTFKNDHDYTLFMLRWNK